MAYRIICKTARTRLVFQVEEDIEGDDPIVIIEPIDDPEFILPVAIDTAQSVNDVVISGGGALVLSPDAVASGDAVSNVTISAGQQSAYLWQINQLTYEGAVALDSPTSGENGSIGYMEQLGLSKEGSSIFMTGRTYSGSNGLAGTGGLLIAEHTLPAFLNTLVYQDLPRSSTAQPFMAYGDRAPTGAVDNDTILGLYRYEGHLIAHCCEWYDGAADNTHTTLVVDDYTDLENSSVKGIYEAQYAGGSGYSHHGAGWISPVPVEWQGALGANHIAGNSAVVSIISRASVGQSAFAVNLNDITDHVATTGQYGATTLMDFPLATPVGGFAIDDPAGIYTVLSRNWLGVIIPGTNTYACFGSHGGVLGISYKGTDDSGHTHGGYNADIKADQYNYYWLYDVRDFVRVLDGEIAMSDILPYDRGILDIPFQEIRDPVYQPLGYSRMLGACYDESDGCIYIALNYNGNNGKEDKPLLKFSLGL